MIAELITAVCVSAMSTTVASYPVVIEFHTDGGFLPIPVEIAFIPVLDKYEIKRLPGGIKQTGPSYKEGVHRPSVTFYGLDGRPEAKYSGDGSLEAPNEDPAWTVDLAPYDSTLSIDLASTRDRIGNRLGVNGLATWTKRRPGGDAVMRGYVRPAGRYDIGGFAPLSGADGAAASYWRGRWRVDFESAEDDAVAIFEVDSRGAASGTFLTTTGDYRQLQGRVDGLYMRLATFDGAHAFLFTAELQNDNSLRGHFYSGNWWHETWTAVRDDDYQLPDPFGLTTITDDNFAALSFPDLRGEDRTIGEFLDKGPTIIEVFGSWCPNCTDASDLLAEYVQAYEDLNVLGLAVEFGKDHETNASRVRKHLDHHLPDPEKQWPVLIASTTIDKAEATTELGFLDKVRSYPTLIFVDDGEVGPEVRAVYTGFNGPATGDAHLKMREDFERIINNMLRD